MKRDITYKDIKKAIEEAISMGYKKFVIAPFGEYGIPTKQVLNWCYGIKEEVIIDNELSKVNDDIISFDMMDELEWEEKYAVIITTANKKIKSDFVSRISSRINAYFFDIFSVTYMCDDSLEDYILKFKTLTKTKSVLNYGLTRVGGIYDGGYVMLDDFSNVSVAYSFGISDEITWEYDMALKNINVHMYDPYINALPYNHPKFSFRREGIGAVDDVENRLYCIQTLLKNNNDLDECSLILKMDVEGAEYSFFDSVSNVVLSKFKQMTFELHNLLSDEKKNEIISILTRISETHQAIWVHANNSSKVVRTSSGEVMPDVLEITYVRKSDYEFAEGECCYPIFLDYPNISYKDEVILGTW